MTTRVKKRKKRDAAWALQAADSYADEMVKRPERSEGRDIEPVRPKKSVVTELVKRITGGNSHGEVDFG